MFPVDRQKIVAGYAATLEFVNFRRKITQFLDIATKAPDGKPAQFENMAGGEVPCTALYVHI